MTNKDSISQEVFERIERYVLDSMSREERTGFEQELLENEGLSEKLQTVAAILNDIEEVALRQNMQVFHQNLEENTQTSKKGVKFGISLAVAASLLLLIGFSFWIFFIRPGTNERLFTTYFQADPGLLTAMGSSENYEFERGMIDYKMGEYAAAIRRWEDLLPDKPENDTLNYFLGAAHLGLKHTALAEMHFRKVAEKESSPFRKDAFWYLGLVYVLDKEYEKAIQNLRESNHPEKDEIIQNIRSK